MAFDRKDYETATHSNIPPPADVRSANLGIIMRAAVKAEALTGDPAWDEFLSYIQHGLNSTTKQRDECMSQMMNPSINNPNDLANIRMLIIRFNERIEVLTGVLALPKQIKQMGEGAAKKMIATEDKAA